MSKTVVKDWDEIQRGFKAIQRMSCKPNFSKLSKDWVTDENQSVKWNREQVELNNRNYEKAVAELNTKKNKMRDSIMEDIYLFIQDEVGCDLDKESAKEIWAYAYDKGHSCGIYEIKIHLDEIIELVSGIIERRPTMKHYFDIHDQKKVASLYFADDFSSVANRVKSVEWYFKSDDVREITLSEYRRLMVQYGGAVWTS